MEGNGVKRGVFAYTLCIYAAMWLLSAIHSAEGILQTATIDFFALSDSVKGLPSGTVSAFAVVAFVLVLVLVGRMRKSTMLILGLALGALSLCAMLLKLSFGTFMVLMAGTGLATGIIDALNSCIISELYPGKASYMCLLHSMYGLSGLAMPFVFRALLTNAALSWRFSYFLVGLLTLAACVMTILTVRRSRDAYETAPVPSERVTLASVREILTEKRLLPVALSLLFVGMYYNGMQVWSSRFIQFGHNGEEYLNFVMPAIALGITVSRLLMSLFPLDMYRLIKILPLLAAGALFAATQTASPVAALILLFVSTFFFGPCIPLGLTIGGTLVEKHRFAVTVLLMLLLLGGQAAISPVIGLAENRWGINAAMNIPTGVITLGWLFALRIKRV